MTSQRAETIRPLLALALGALVLAAGVALARQGLPEWRTELPDEAFFLERYQEVVRRAGVRLAPGEPTVSVVTRSSEDDGEEVLDGHDPEVLASLGAGALVQVEQQALPDGKGSPRQLIVQFSPSGQPMTVVWSPRGVDLFTAAAGGAPASTAFADRFLQRLLLPGEKLGPERRPDGITRQQERVYPVIGSRPPQHLEMVAPYSDFVTIRRRAGEGKEGSSVPPALGLLSALPQLLGFLTVPVLFVVLIAKRRIDLINGAILAVVSFLASALTFIRDPSLLLVLDRMIPAAFVALWVFLIWSAAESFLRAVQPGFATSLDSLRAGRLGPRGGRSLLFGLGAGAALGGLFLAASAAAAALQWVRLEEHSVELPVFAEANPFANGAILAGAVAMVTALAHRFLPARVAPWAAVLVGALAFPPLEVEPYPADVVVGLALIGLLFFTLRRFGLTALLVAAVAAYLLPAAALSGLAIDWLPVTFAVTAGVPAVLLVLGMVGVRRPERVEQGRIQPPAFIRRLEEERRVKYEMDLLSRMQLGLLPTRLPEVPGWEIAARSLIATEAGGDLYDTLVDDEGNLWIATGDVAGHGYSCAIAQAMTVAALTSLITAGQTPSRVLQGVDRVIRRSGTHRHFTSLALMRLDAKTGEALLSNAGHPFPLLLALEGQVMEIDLPGLPLGQGPGRRYGDIAVEIPPQGALVFCSDGLFEAADWQEAPYGYDRPQELLRTLGNRSAGEILEALLADWRRHLGETQPQDDTTVLVVKRQ